MVYATVLSFSPYFWSSLHGHSLVKFIVAKD